MIRLAGKRRGDKNKNGVVGEVAAPPWPPFFLLPVTGLQRATRLEQPQLLCSADRGQAVVDIKLDVNAP